MNVDSSCHSDTYVAKLDEAGRTVWDRAYTDGTQLSCQQGRYAAKVSLITRRDGAVFAFGSGMGNDGDEGCNWMARLSFNTE